MKIATFNTNSIRARLPILLDWLATEQPDVLAIQETKVEDKLFPEADIQDLGYHAIFHGMKSYNGVAVLSKEPGRTVMVGMPDPAFPVDCRLLVVDVGGVRIVNTYVPNGNTVGSDKFAYKLAWLDRFHRLCEETLDPSAATVWLGDINIAPSPDDVFEPENKLGSVGHHPDEFAALEKVMAWGWTDLFRTFTQGSGHYTFWEYMIPNAFKRNLGWRIDHIYAPPALAAKCTSCVIDLEPRKLDRPSDHTFVVADFDLP